MASHMKDFQSLRKKLNIEMHGKKYAYLLDARKMRFHTLPLPFFPTISTFSPSFLKHTTQIYVEFISKPLG